MLPLSHYRKVATCTFLKTPFFGVLRARLLVEERPGASLVLVFPPPFEENPAEAPSLKRALDEGSSEGPALRVIERWA